MSDLKNAIMAAVSDGCSVEFRSRPHGLVSVEVRLEDRNAYTDDHDLRCVRAMTQEEIASSRICVVALNTTLAYEAVIAARRAKGEDR